MLINSLKKLVELFIRETILQLSQLYLIFFFVLSKS